VVPAKVAPGRAPALLDHAEIRDHREDGVPGAVSVIGVKYTTARAVARRAVDLACRQLGRKTELHAPLESLTNGESRLGRLYGPEARTVLALSAGTPDLSATLADDVQVTAAEVVHAVRSELALTLEDVVIRRTGLGAAGHPGQAVVSACAAIMARELGWSAERVSDEMAGVDRFYDVGRSRSVESSDARRGQPVQPSPGVSH